MKNLILSFLFAVVIGTAVGFANSFEIADRAAAKTDAAVTDTSTHSPPVTAGGELISVIREQAAPAVLPSVGHHVLNTTRVVPEAVETSKGYPTAILKPKIETGRTFTSPTIGYKGLGGNHFARADV